MNYWFRLLVAWGALLTLCALFIYNYLQLT